MLKLPGIVSVSIQEGRQSECYMEHFNHISVIIYSLRVLIQEMGWRDLQNIFGLLLNPYVTGNK